jgi:ATP-dependent Lon protease
MATALISVMTGRAVDKYVAMTGEITLRGRVLPIGGLKEKALGALRGGIRTVILPEKNKKDLSEIPANIKRKIKFITVRHMDEVLPIALAEIPARKKKAAGRRRTSSKSSRAGELQG